MVTCFLGELYEELDADAALKYTGELCQLRNLDDGKEGVRFLSPEMEDQKKQVREFFEKICPK